MDVDGISPLPQGIDSAFEADALERGLIGSGCALHDSTDAVVGNGVHHDLFANHRGGFASQHVHAHGDLDIAEEQFYCPALEVKPTKALRGPLLGVDEGSEQDIALDPEARLADLDLDHAHHEGGGQLLPFALVPLADRLKGTFHADKPVAWTQAFTGTEGKLQGLMFSHEGIDPTRPERSHRGVGAEAAVSKEQIATAQMLPERGEQLRFMIMLVALSPVDEHTVGEMKKPHQFNKREATAWFLSLGLRPALLVGRGVGHGGAGPVDDLNRSAELMGAEGSLLNLSGNTMVDLSEPRKRESAAGLAVGAGTGAGQWRIARGLPGLQFAQRLPTGTLRTEHLGQERPEGSATAEEPLSASSAFGGWFQQARRYIVGEEAGELAQRGALKSLRLMLEPLTYRARRAAEKLPAKEREEWGGSFHVSSIYTYTPMTMTFSKQNELKGAVRREYQRLAMRLEKLPLLAQGSVFQIDPPDDAPRASTRYMWTRKVKAKTVTKALSKEQYEQLKAAIEANRRVEAALKRMREISQAAIVSAPKKTARKGGQKTP